MIGGKRGENLKIKSLASILIALFGLFFNKLLPIISDAINFEIITILFS